MTEEKYQELVNKIKDFLNTIPSFNYKGRGMNDGTWHIPSFRFFKILIEESFGIKRTN